MYKVNGIELTGSQFRELRDLVSLPSDEDRKAFSEKALRPYGDDALWNPNGLSVYKNLKREGLIEGIPAMNAFLFDGEVTQDGIDFIRDLEQEERDENARIWSDRRFQIALSICTIIVSALVSAIVSLLIP